MDAPLDLLGEPTDPADLELGPTQRLVVRALRELRTLTSDEAGAIAHEQRRKHGRHDRCAYCAIDGHPILDRLIQLGHAERGAEGAVQLPRRHTVPDTQDIPY
jgi:hypothetical protein